MRGALLLDTCAAIWAAEDQLKPEAANILSQRYAAGEPVLISPITAWEIGLLFARGRLRATLTPMEFFRRLTNVPGVRLAELAPEVLVGSSFLPGLPPADPADRVIAATAREYGLTVVTRDSGLLAYAKQGHLRALVC
jgi:PIN domain nuclease of toxin-antitoxin system